ncbi:M23 family metallopeptidase [Geitlerinema sp. PCC 9228]|jgi:murein DD-endopeptidase MepM/ murein hydrolase activator NlpD|uniref:M23 family metallopeptidase n=1 Tax=Geitlerinema sp. PCC 9228 TaxID=111611 RepID=UPI0008F9D35C|nr:M23 family metallopeptidase [Geitlerinema sp. PCC 9228]
MKWKFLLPLLVSVFGLVSGRYQQLPQAAAMPQQRSPFPLAQNKTNLQFSQPIDCTLGEDCFILNYVDRDPSPQAIDFACRGQTYNGHKGTDFALRDMQAMEEGVEVLAAASGTVIATRDGMPDRRITSEKSRQEVEGTECGNGVVIDHGNGWRSQYCHLKQGSVVVSQGDEVSRGQVLGEVGSSGLSSFPHVHLSLRFEGDVVDPFVGRTQATGCQVERNPLWQDPISYTPAGEIRSGFATERPSTDEVWQGKFHQNEFSTDVPLLIFWMQAYGVEAGDVETVRLTSPDGEVVAETQQSIDRSHRIWLRYVGKRNSQQRPLTPGVWRAEYQLKRGDRILIDRTQQVRLR